MPNKDDYKSHNWKHTHHSNSALYEYHIDSDDTVILHPLKQAGAHEIGAIKKVIPPEICRGTRVRFQADIETRNTDGAGLWLTTSHKDWHVTDGMYDRLVTGSHDWQHVELVLDVPLDAMYVSYGLWMKGNGECRMRCARFDIVDMSVNVSTDKIWDRVDSQRWVERP